MTEPVTYASSRTHFLFLIPTLILLSPLCFWFFDQTATWAERNSRMNVSKSLFYRNLCAFWPFRRSICGEQVLTVRGDTLARTWKDPVFGPSEVPLKRLSRAHLRLTGLRIQGTPSQRPCTLQSPPVSSSRRESDTRARCLQEKGTFPCASAAALP